MLAYIFAAILIYCILLLICGSVCKLSQVKKKSPTMPQTWTSPHEKSINTAIIAEKERVVK